MASFSGATNDLVFELIACIASCDNSTVVVYNHGAIYADALLRAIVVIEPRNYLSGVIHRILELFVGDTTLPLPLFFVITPIESAAAAPLASWVSVTSSATSLAAPTVVVSTTTKVVVTTTSLAA